MRRTALILPEASGPRNGISGSGPPLSILIVGDSSAAGVGASDQADALCGQLIDGLSRSHQVSWTLIARTGATTRSTIDALKAVPREKFDIAVTALGVNDLTKGLLIPAWLAQQAELRTVLREKFGARRLFVSGLPPVRGFPLLPIPLRLVLGWRAIRFDIALKQALNAEADTMHIPLEFAIDPSEMAQDGYHPGPRIYAGWARRLTASILETRPCDF